MKYNDEYLEKEFGIYKFDEESYMIEENVFNTNSLNDDYSSLKDVDLDGLDVKADDVLLVLKFKDLENGYTQLVVENLTNKKVGYVVGYYYSDDGRADTVNAIANHFKHIKNVCVTNYLIYSKEETEKYVDMVNEI